MIESGVGQGNANHPMHLVSWLKEVESQGRKGEERIVVKEDGQDGIPTLLFFLNLLETCLHRRDAGFRKG